LSAWSINSVPAGVAERERRRRGEGRRIEPAISVARVVIEDRLARELKTVLHKRVGIPLSQLHLRNALLSLLHGRQSEQKTREGGAGAVVGCCSRSEAVGELIVTAILKEAP
jgi:hypothetical protein